MKMAQQDLNQDIDFSIISPQTSNKNALNFSLESLLSNHPQKESSLSQSQNRQNQPQPDGSFMRDLQKMEKEISYDSVAFNIYENSECHIQCTGTMQAKQQSTCARTLNNMTKVGSRMQQKKSEPDVKYLILDFKEEKDLQKVQNFKQKAIDYFGVNKCCRCHRSQIVHSPKADRNSFQLPKNNLMKTTKRKSKILSREKSLRSARKSFDPNITKKQFVKNKKNGKIDNTKKKISTSKSKSKSNERKLFKSKSGIKKIKTETEENIKEDVISEYFGYSSFRHSKIQKGLAKKVKIKKSSSKQSKQSKSQNKGKKRTIVYSHKNVHKKN